MREASERRMVTDTDSYACSLTNRHSGESTTHNYHIKSMKLKYLTTFIAATLMMFATSCEKEEVRQKVDVNIGNVKYNYFMEKSNYNVGETLKVRFESNSQKGIVVNFMDENTLIESFPYEYSKKLTQAGTFPLNVYLAWEMEGENIIIKGESSTSITISVTK